MTAPYRTRIALAGLVLLQAACATAPLPRDVGITRLGVAFFADRPGLSSQERTLGTPSTSDVVLVKFELVNPHRAERPATLVCAEEGSNRPSVQRAVRLEAEATQQVTVSGFMASVVAVPIRCRLTFADRAPTPWVRQIIPANDNLLDRPL